MDLIWQSLKKVTQLTLQAEYAGERWTGQGCVDVHTLPSGNGLVFEESGAWHATKGDMQPFVNQYTWSFDSAQSSLSLFRKRAEAEMPELLAEFTKNVAYHTQVPSWTQKKPHLCGKDCYTAVLCFTPEGLSLEWLIRGPKKEDRVRILYR